MIILVCFVPENEVSVNDDAPPLPEFGFNPVTVYLQANSSH